MDEVEKDTEIKEEQPVEVEEKTFTKEQILKSKKYKDQRDIINALLVNGRSYSLKTVDEMIKKFMKGEIK